MVLRKSLGSSLQGVLSKSLLQIKNPNLKVINRSKDWKNRLKKKMNKDVNASRDENLQ